MRASEVVDEALVELQASSRLYHGTISDITAAARSSLETAWMIQTASSIRADWASVYQPLAATAVATAEMQAFIADIQTPLALAEWIAPLKSSLATLASASAAVWTAAPAPEAPVDPALSGWLLEAPVVQTYQASRNLVQFVTVEKSGSLETKEPPSKFQPRTGTLAERLKEVGRQFLTPYFAAQDAILSKREDYIRHAGTSLRELLDALIVHFAPDARVKSWPPSAKHLKQTPRKARLQYLFRHVGAGAYAAFVEADIDLILQTFYALNKAVHSLGEPFTEEEMHILVTRVDGNLLMILEAAEVERLHDETRQY